MRHTPPTKALADCSLLYRLVLNFDLSWPQDNRPAEKARSGLSWSPPARGFAPPLAHIDEPAMWPARDRRKIGDTSEPLLSTSISQPRTAACILESPRQPQLERQCHIQCQTRGFLRCSGDLPLPTIP